MSDAGWDGAVAGLYVLAPVTVAAFAYGLIRAGIRGLLK